MLMRITLSTLGLVHYLLKSMRKQPSLCFFPAKAQQQDTTQALTSPKYKLGLQHDPVSEKKEQHYKNKGKNASVMQKLNLAMLKGPLVDDSRINPLTKNVLWFIVIFLFSQSKNPEKKKTPPNTETPTSVLQSWLFHW